MMHTTTTNPLLKKRRKKFSSKCQFHTSFRQLLSLSLSKLLTFGLFPIQCCCCRACRAEKERVHHHKKSDANLGKQLIKKPEVILSLYSDDNKAEIRDNYLEETLCVGCHTWVIIFLLLTSFHSDMASQNGAQPIFGPTPIHGPMKVLAELLASVIIRN